MINQLKPVAAITELKAPFGQGQGHRPRKILDQLVEAMEKLGQNISMADAEKSIKWSREIVSLDPENKSGLNPKHEFRVLMADAAKAFDERKFEKCRTAVEKAVALPGLSGEQTQAACLFLRRCYREEKNLPKCLDCLKKALKRPRIARRPRGQAVDCRRGKGNREGKAVGEERA